MVWVVALTSQGRKALAMWRLAQKAPGDGADRKPSEGDGLTVSDAAKIADVNPGVITRAVDSGKLKGNEQKGRERRIDRADLTRWIQERGGKPEPGESDEQVRRLVNKHVR
jgi:excisionase family DNA binding protein